jgi:hypothetical protein
MSTAFIIMQIGNRELDEVFEKSILPAILSCGLEAKRVDKHNEGGLLKSEIIQFINVSDIIIADLTNERPNCYLEVGYAMGIDKFRNLILTAKEDHFPDSPNFVKGGPKIHFDLAGYDILSWESEDLEGFRTNLEKRIKRRLAIIRPEETTPVFIWDSDWIKNNREQSEEGMKKFNIQGATEIKFALHPPKITSTPQKLVEAAKNSIIHTFGWPIGVFLEGIEEFTPKPRADGIWNEVYREDRPSYDYWAIKRNGDFYSLVSYFEDSRDPGHLFIETRIIRATEALLYCGRLYSRLGVDQNASIKFALRFIGLKNRILTSAHPNRRFSLRERKCREESVESEVSISLPKIESDLVAIVKELTSPLFTLFDFAEFGDEYYEAHVNKFINGNL